MTVAIGAYQLDNTIGAWQSTGVAAVYTIDLASGSYSITGSRITLSETVTSIPVGWLACKDQGPWDFTVQANKWGYLNNPNWTENPQGVITYDRREDEEPQVWKMNQKRSSGKGYQHLPCGHWHKGKLGPIEQTSFSFFVLNEGSGPLWGGLFDLLTNQISFIGYYTNTAHLHGLIYNPSDPSILSVEGEGSITELIHIQELSNAIFTKTAVSADFYTDGTYNANLIRLTDGSMFVQEEYGRLTKFDSSFNPTAIGYDCTVTEGTDSNLYSPIFSYDWSSSIYDDFKPVTGASWGAFWKAVPFNDYDGPVTTYGTGTLYSAISNSWVSGIHEYNGKLYFVRNSSVSSRCIRKYNSNTLTIEEQINLGENEYPNRSVLDGNILYISAGIFSCIILAYDLNTSPMTRLASYAIGVDKGRLGALCVTDQYVISVTEVYSVDSWTITVLEKKTLNYVKSVNYPYGDYSPGEFGYYRFTDVVTLNNRYILLTYGDLAAVFDLVSMIPINMLYVPISPPPTFSGGTLTNYTI